MLKIIGVRFKSVGKVYYFDPKNYKLAIGDKVIVETARGVECGEVAMVDREIDESTFPDPGVRAAVAAADTNGDGEISREEADSLTQITIDGATNISGLGIFGNLESVLATGENLQDFDITDAKSVKTVDLSQTKVATVEVSGLPNLESLNLRSTGISEIDVSGCGSLAYLDVQGTALQSIDVSGSIHGDSTASTTFQFFAPISRTGIGVDGIQGGRRTIGDNVEFIVGCNGREALYIATCRELPFQRSIRFDGAEGSLLSSDVDGTIGADDRTATVSGLGNRVCPLDFASPGVNSKHIALAIGGRDVKRSAVRREYRVRCLYIAFIITSSEGNLAPFVTGDGNLGSRAF